MYFLFVKVKKCALHDRRRASSCDDITEEKWPFHCEQRDRHADRWKPNQNILITVLDVQFTEVDTKVLTLAKSISAWIQIKTSRLAKEYKKILAVYCFRG